MGRIPRIILTLGLGAVMAFTLVSCDGSGGGGGGGGDATLTSIEVTPQNPSIALLGTQQFTATGKYTDGGTRDLTTQLTWSTADTAVATAGSQGLVTSVSEGTTTVTATNTASGISGSTGLNSGCTASVSNDGPVSQRSGANVTLALSCSGAATSYSCSTGSARICFSGPEDFETDVGPFTTVNATLAACGANGVTTTNCVANDGTPDVLEFDEATTGTATVSGIDATGFTDLQVHLRAAFAAATDINDNINVNACCGSGCTPANVGTAFNLNSGGTDNWQERGPFSLVKAAFDNCAFTTVGFSFSTISVGEVAHMDDYALSGLGTFALSLTDNLDGTYTGGFAACAADTVPVTCTWSTANGTFQADNTTDVTFN
jgi:hypothetical protein